LKTLYICFGGKLTDFKLQVPSVTAINELRTQMKTKQKSKGTIENLFEI
jgi:hypothetical protein